MKNAVIGNNKQKANLIVLGAVPRYITVKPSFCSKHALIIFKSRHAKTDTTGFFFSVDPCTVRKTYCSSCHFHCSVSWLCSPVEKLQLYPYRMCVGFFLCVSPDYCTCSNSAPPVLSWGQSVQWCWEVSPWAPRTTSSPLWTVTSSPLFFKVGKRRSLRRSSDGLYLRTQF